MGATQGDDRLGGVKKGEGDSSRAAYSTAALVALSGDGDADEKNWASGADNWLVWKVTNSQAMHNDHVDVGEIKHGPIGMYAQVKISADCEALPNPCTGGKQRQSDGSCACPSGQVEDGSGTCVTPPICPTDLKLLPVCASDQKPELHCCKPLPLDPVCSEAELAQYCCDVARDACCKPCDAEKKKDICEDDQNPDLFCCTCKKPYEQRPICKAGQVPAGINKSGTKAAEVVCCRLEPATSTPVPVNNPWALGLLGAAVAAAAAARRRRSTRRDDDA